MEERWEQARLIDMPKLTDPDSRNRVKNLLAGVPTGGEAIVRRRWKN
jgi:hypothetical protein